MSGYTFDDFPHIEANMIKKGYQWVGTTTLTKFVFEKGQFKVVSSGTREEAQYSKFKELVGLLSEDDRKKYNIGLVSVLMTGSQGQQRLAFFAKATPK